MIKDEAEMDRAEVCSKLMECNKEFLVNYILYLDEWITKYQDALDKACIELVKLKECADCWEYEEHCPFRNRCKEGTNYCYDTRCWKELLLKEDE